KPTVSFTTPPSPAEGATLTTSSVSFAFSYNRKPNQVGNVSCTLSGPTAKSGCASATTASYSGLANGDYAFTVSLTLTDGGTASATRQFTVNVPVTSHLYWSTLGTNPTTDGTIAMANLDGTSPQTIVNGQNTPHHLAVG